MTNIINTKILLSGATIVAAAALIIGATYAFFSDTETSENNVFVAGALDLKIDSEAHYNGSVCTNVGTLEQPVYEWVGEEGVYPDGLTCVGTWPSGDLTSEQFFNFEDVKPGDSGENTISLTVEDNDAWACMRIDNMQNLENGINGPEADALDVTDPEGELAQNLHFTSWLDQGATLGWQGLEDVGEGDNIWGGDETEPLLFSNVEGPASDVLGGVTYPLAQPGLNGDAVIEGLTTNYIGLQWCAGDLTVDTTLDTITCDGSTMGNESQTDSLSADIHFYAEQSRNNDEFSCSDVVWPVVEEV